MTNENSLGGILRELVQTAAGEKISLGEIVQAFERRGFGPLLLVPSIILVLPTGAIPGMPIICGLMILFVTSQLALGYKTPWVPERLRGMRFESRILRNGVEKIMPIVSRIDRWTGRRFVWLVAPTFQRIIGLLCLLIALLIIPLGAIPFAIFLPSLVILFFSLGLVADDGLLIAIGLTVAGAFAVLGGMWWL